MKADRVCYLPQFIGYHYFINGGSIVQDKKKPWEDIYECFRSAGLTIDNLESVGVDANDIAQLFYSMLTQYYLASVIGILVFIVVAVISLIVYGLLPSVKNEEDFQ